VLELYHQRLPTTKSASDFPAQMLVAGTEALIMGSVLTDWTGGE
jgi:hypothetical protein